MFFAMTRTVYIETYGCQMNVSDSELMLGKLTAEGYTPVDRPDGADVILVNTCAIRDHAEQRVIGRIEGRIEAIGRQDGSLLAEQPIHPLFPRKPVGVQGPAEVEQHGSSVVRDQRGVRAVEVWWNPASFIWGSHPYCTTVCLGANR